MPAGKPWLSKKLKLQFAPAGVPLWHVYHKDYDPLSVNARSTARFALVGTHGMYYVASSLAGALWETVLRDVEPDEHRNVLIAPGKLYGMRAVQVQLVVDTIPLLQLGRPGVLALVPSGNSPQAKAIAALVNDPDHAVTHPEAQGLWAELQKNGFTEMPMLNWPSRQLNSAEVYLAYAPPMEESWWEVLSTPMALDDPASGIPEIQAELSRHGFTWTPLATFATTRHQT